MDKVIAAGIYWIAGALFAGCGFFAAIHQELLFSAGCYVLAIYAIVRAIREIEEK